MHYSSIFHRSICYVVGALVAGGSWFYSAPSYAADQPISLVSEGKTNAVVVAAADQTVDGRLAIDDLVKWIHQSSGATLPIESASQDGRLEIHIGATDYVKSLTLSLEDLGLDGFKILFPAPNRIVLIGNTTSGTEFAIYDFLERYIGVRWLFPGELGTDVPKHQDITIPTDEIDSRPAFISRTISTMGGGEAPDPVHVWLQHHRRHWTISHHHNLNKLFPPSVYFKTHPEFFPLIRGERIEPEPEGYEWQPVFTADGIVEEAVKNINQYFDTNPSSTSYSLGINDNNNFGHPAERINSVNQGDYSDYVFNFYNKVVEGVLEEHPDKWFGCLAYVGITDPPQNIQVNPRIVPHICIDRHGWASKEGEQRDIERTQAWHKAAPVLGWYDYIYGDDMYRIPRIYNHLMARYLKFGAENGVKAYYAEYYGAPEWIDGPKLYVLMKLLWNPDTDVNAVQNEWYRLAVGEKAAQPLAKYYQLWEDYWMQRVPKTDWFQQYVGRVYMDFDQLGYLDELTIEDLQSCKKLIQQVVELAETPIQKKRATFIASGFEKTLKNVEYHVRLRNMTVKVESPQSAILAESFRPNGVADDKITAPWAAWQNDPGTARFYWDHRNGHKDSHSLAVNAENAGASVVFYRDLNVGHPTVMHHLSAVVQCNDVNDDAYVGIEVRWQRVDGKYLPRKYTSNRSYSAKYFKKGVWTPLDVFTMPPHDVGPLTISIRMSALGAQKGIIRLDDMTLSVVDETRIEPR